VAEPRRLKQLAESINERARFPDQPHVIALSGGADSAALAGLLGRRPEAGPRCVHVHHGLAASDLLAEAAQAIANRLQVAIEIVRVEVQDGPSPEAMAREVRYRALAGSLGEGENMLLAHTRNDQAETVLLNLIRGAGIRGLSGMPYYRQPRMYRPFLDVTRDETREFASLCGLPFVDDPTNSDVSIRRNRVRLELIPRMEVLNPNIVDTLARTAEHLRRDSEYLDGVSQIPLLVDEESVFVATGVLLALDRPIRSRVIAGLVGSVRARDGISSAELARVEDVLGDRSVAAELEGGVSVSKRGPYLVVGTDAGQ
jgi:tRNA(Ile)-lysidine synthetase-like protein